MRPIDPGPCDWQLPDGRRAPAGVDLVGIGADLQPATVVHAYRSGLFPMHLDDGVLGWWSPDPRGVLRLDRLRVTRSMRASARRMEVTFDADFESVIRGCSQRQGALSHEQWINDSILAAYVALHHLGWAHSVEVWRDGQLVGGLYGVEVGGLFAGESMFHRQRDASKVALMALVERLSACGGDRIVDVQWRTEHLGSLGVEEHPRPRYLEMLAEVLPTAPCLGT